MSYIAENNYLYLSSDYNILKQIRAVIIFTTKKVVLKYCIFFALIVFIFAFLLIHILINNTITYFHHRLLQVVLQEISIVELL